MCWLSGDHAVSSRHLKVFCSSRENVGDAGGTSDKSWEGAVERWVTRAIKDEKTPLALSKIISPTSTTTPVTASCEFLRLKRNGLAGSFSTTRTDRSCLILSSVSVGSNGSR